MMLHQLSETEKEQYKDVAEQLRCLVCQNQSIYDSQAGLADDLKTIIVDQIREGQSKQEIKQYMVDRYGEFVLYKPTMSSANAVLWAGPVIVLLLAALLAKGMISKRRSRASQLIVGPDESNTPNQSSESWAERLYQQEKQKR